MTIKMPRGAIPSPRGDIAASEPYRAESGEEIFVPSGGFPTPNSELASAQRYKVGGAAPESFLSWPMEIGFWGNEKAGNSSWAEEAFAKACAEPKVFVPTDVVLHTARECGSSNFARFMQTHGFQINGAAYLDGPFNLVSWTNTAVLNSAIAKVGPVKIGVASANLASGPHGHVTPGTSGWAIYALPTGQSEDHCASLCGYGPMAALVALFERNGVEVKAPAGMPQGLCYAMFAWGSIGIVDRQSLMNITGEAWVRSPTTIVKNSRRVTVGRGGRIDTIAVFARIETPIERWERRRAETWRGAAQGPHPGRRVVQVASVLASLRRRRLPDLQESGSFPAKRGHPRVPVDVFPPLTTHSSAARGRH